MALMVWEDGSREDMGERHRGPGPRAQQRGCGCGHAVNRGHAWFRTWFTQSSGEGLELIYYIELLFKYSVLCVCALKHADLSLNKRACFYNPPSPAKLRYMMFRYCWFSLSPSQSPPVLVIVLLLWGDTTTKATFSEGLLSSWGVWWQAGGQAWCWAIAEIHSDPWA